VKRAAAVALVLLATGCGGSARKVPPDAVALVGDRPITRAALAAELARADAEPTKAVRDAALAVLVDHARLELEALKAHISVSPKKVDARLRAYKKSTFAGDDARFRAELRREGMTEAGVRDDIRWQLLADALRGEHVQAPDVTYAPGYEP
jgi:hypothetical protein